MKSNHILKISALCLAGMLAQVSMLQAEEVMFGKLTKAEFDALNKKGGEMVKAIKPTADPLSEKDMKFFEEIAMGGTMNLETSKVAVKMATDPVVKAMATAEVEEQTGLSAKLKEIATAKGAPAPAGPDEKLLKEVKDLEELKAEKFDKTYNKDTGVKGHQMLKKTMESVSKGAEDPALKELATATLPVIEAHLDAAKAADRTLR